MASVLRQKGNGALRRVLGKGRVEVSVKEGFQAPIKEGVIQAKEVAVSS